jgi:hypothetical protein
MRNVISAAPVVAFVLLGSVVSAPASAEHLTVTPEARPDAAQSTKLDIDFKLGADGFRMGARVFGTEGVYGAWLNGRVRPNGITVDGRVQDRAKAHNFTVNADVWEGLMRAAMRSLPGF